MAQSNVIQTRVDDETKERLEEKAENQGETLAGYLRQILDADTDNDQHAGNSISQQFAHNLYTIGMNYNNHRRIAKILQDNWDALTGINAHELREALIVGSDTVYVAGQGSSYTVARWLAHRISEKGPPTAAHTAETVPVHALGSDDILFLVAHSPDDSISELAERAQETEATTLWFGPPTSRAADRSTYLLPLPEYREHRGPYNARHTILQMIISQITLFMGTPNRMVGDTWRDNVGQLFQDWVNRYLTVKQDEDTGEETIWMARDTQVWQAAEALDAQGDLAADPIITGLSHRTVGPIAKRTHTGVLHTHADYDDLGSVRDDLLNVLYGGDAYLLTTIPHLEHEDAYQRAINYLFRQERSIENLLKLNAEPQDLRLLAFTFNDDGPLEQRIRSQSLYGDDAVITLPATDKFQRDLELVLVNYLLAYAILEKRWPQDREFRQALLNGPTTYTDQDHQKEGSVPASSAASLPLSEQEH